MRLGDPSLRDLRLPIAATAGIAVVIAAMLMGSSLYIVLGAAAIALVAIWAVGLEMRRERRDAGARQFAQLMAIQTAASQRLAEAQEESARLQKLLNLLPMAVLAADAQRRITLCNPAAAALLELALERIVGRTVEEVFTQAEILDLLQRARGGQSVRAQARISRSGGPRLWEVSALERAGILGIALRDVTEEARSLQVRTEFVANASHELRTPIAAMRMAVETLSALDESDAASRARFLEMAARNLDRLEAIVRDLLDLSRLEALEGAPRRDPIAASDLAAELAPLYEQALRERRLRLAFDFASDLEHMRSDRELLLLILGNLIDNAAKFAFEGTAITVSGERVGDLARLVVADQGVGIPLDQQQRIFERFYQVDPVRSVGSPRRGTGLGLAIVKHALRRLGGSIRVESVWQQGTRMIVELPAFPNSTPLV